MEEVLRQEKWLPVRGHEGQYEVSDQARVRSLDRTVTQLDRWGNQTTRKLKGRILKQARTKKLDGSPGYAFVKMPGNKTLLVHRAMLEAFRGPCPDGMRDGCHGDDNPENNALENLSWDTHANNQVTAVGNGRNFNANKTRCKNDHEYTLENTIYRTSANGRQRRDCRACQRDSTARHRSGQA